MDEFLQSVEKRAYQMARFATGNSDEALDLVQDTMLAFVRRYSDKAPEERRPLFFTILQNRIRDWYRRQSVRNRLSAWWFGSRGEEENSSAPDPISQIPDPAGRSPEEHWRSGRVGEAINRAIEQLPLRQQQAFLLRAWEELSVTDTARAMGCSEGSVKTHYSRAVQTLRELLEEQGP